MPRLDRVATVYFGYPLVRVFGRRPSSCTPVLMYHSISDNLFGKSHTYYQINTQPEIFALQMKWLRNNGYRSLDIPELLISLQRGDDLSKTIVITFDDGYRDFYTEAAEVMKQCGFTATIYLVSSRIKDESLRFEGVDYLTWSEVRELQRQGIRFGSHTVTHPDLRSLGPEQIEYELGYSKEFIEDKLGAPVDSFAYPFAFPEEDTDFARFVTDALRNHGYENGVSTIIGRSHSQSNPFLLPRLPVNNWDDHEFLAAKLAGGYDWLHVPQRIKKVINHHVTSMQRSSQL